MRARARARVLNKKIGTYPTMRLGAARAAAERVLEAIAKDGSTEAVDRTFGAVAEFWIEKIAKPKNDSWRQQKRRLEMYVLPAWRDRRIADIRRADVRELVEGVEGEVLPNRVLTVIKTVFASRSPAIGSKPRRPRALRSLTPKRNATAFWTWRNSSGFGMRVA